MSNSEIFTKEEQETLELTKDIRVRVIKNMTKEGVPDRVGDLRVLNEYLNSLDDVVQKSAANRLKHQDNQNKEAILDMVAETMKSIARQKDEVVVTPQQREIPVNLEPIDVVDGELEIDPEPLNPDEFLGGNK